MSHLRLALRPDHGPGVGAGHLGRCLALAQAWCDRGGSVVFVGAEPHEPWRSRWLAEGATMHGDERWPEAAAYVLDGYRFGAEEQRAVPDGGPLLVVDDYGIVEVARADVVLDQNVGSDSRTQWPAAARALVGPSYALLRRELVAAARSVRRSWAEQPRTVLVSAGGDPPKAWWRALDDAALAVGVRTERLMGLSDVAPAMIQADVGLLAAGSTVWEALALGLPAVVVAFAANQEPLARAVGAAGVALDGGSAAETERFSRLLERLVRDGGLRARLGVGAQRLVDGRGAERVAAVLHELIG